MHEMRYMNTIKGHDVMVSVQDTEHHYEGMIRRARDDRIEFYCLASDTLFLSRLIW